MLKHLNKDLFYRKKTLGYSITKVLNTVYVLLLLFGCKTLRQLKPITEKNPHNDVSPESKFTIRFFIWRLQTF